MDVTIASANVIQQALDPPTRREVRPPGRRDDRPHGTHNLVAVDPHYMLRAQERGHWDGTRPDRGRRAGPRATSGTVTGKVLISSSVVDQAVSDAILTRLWARTP
jgi:hypothetical protein